ncbi:MAG: endolytic transglycosylase MltG [Candidatus Paceibacterota bacterium]|jgi:UPF0755 protein
MHYDFLREIKLYKDPLLKRRLVFLTGSVVALFFIIFYISFLSSPRDFPKGLIYDLKVGQTLSSLASDLSSKHIIKSEFLFKGLVFVISGNSRILEGDYAMPNAQNVVALAWRFAHGDTKISPMRITIPEGLNNYQVADLLYKNLQTFDKKEFLKYATKYEGYLFPDTYLIAPGTKENKVVDMMIENFDEKIKALNTEIKSFGKPLSDVVKMASILEGEARTIETRRTIAGILWRRISLGMPLQVDVSFKYINGKTSKMLTLDDLKIDSPYNSYTNKGLPPTPISNPGLLAIQAAITPIKTPYLYFLADSSGIMHYAVTHDGHVANKEKYLK